MEQRGEGSLQGLPVVTEALAVTGAEGGALLQRERHRPLHRLRGQRRGLDAAIRVWRARTLAACQVRGSLRDPPPPP